MVTSRDTFKILGASSISQERLKLELSNFVQRETISSHTIGFSSEMFCSCRISTDKCRERSLCNSKASCRHCLGLRVVDNEPGSPGTRLAIGLQQIPLK